jgi:hypothetical protein
VAASTLRRGEPVGGDTEVGVRGPATLGLVDRTDLGQAPEFCPTE